MPLIDPNSAECRAAVLLSMVQALSVKYGFDCMGTETDRRRLARMGPEERFQALQIEFVGLSYRLETREMDIRATRVRLEEMTRERDALSQLQSVKSRAEFEEKVVANYKRLHAAEAMEMQTAMERDRQKLKNAINADLMTHIPKQQAATLDDLLQAAGIKPKDSTTRTRLHGLLAEHREKQRLYPAGEVDKMVAKIREFAKDHKPHFEHVNPAPFQIKLPWTMGGGKRKHPVDKVWDGALDGLDERCKMIKTRPPV
jgi:hypothetical protein